MASITERTISACNGLQISALPQDWADQAWSSDFCESSELPEVLENRLVDSKYFVDELQSLLLIARQWSGGSNGGRLNEGNLSSLVLCLSLASSLCRIRKDFSKDYLHPKGKLRATRHFPQR